MRSRFTKTLALILSLLMLMVCMTGCEDLKYREAVQHYNARNYEKAVELFTELGDYEDSAQLHKSCHYWMAMDLMAAGDYSGAWPRFHKLGNFEDSAQRATECKYQMAIAAFDSAQYDTAESFFLEAPDYRQTPEYLRQLNWQKIYSYICTNGEYNGSTYLLIRDGVDRVVSFMVEEADPASIYMSATWSKDMGYFFMDELTLCLPRESTDARFVANSSFVMDFAGTQIGTEQTSTGTVALRTYAAGTPLTVDSYSMTGTDNQGNPLESQDVADSSMADAMVENMAAILEAFPILLAETGAEPIF